MQICWKQMSRIRSNSLCAICSGRSEVFFADKKNAQLLGSDCQPMIDSCLQSFEDIVKLIEGVDRFADKFIVLMKIANNPKDSKLLANVKNLDEITEAIKKNKLHQAMKEFIEKRGTDDEKAKWSLCESFITVNKLPYVSAMGILFSKYDLNPLDDISEIFRSRIATQIIKWSKHRKHLQKSCHRRKYHHHHCHDHHSCHRRNRRWNIRWSSQRRRYSHRYGWRSHSSRDTRKTRCRGGDWKIEHSRLRERRLLLLFSGTFPLPSPPTPQQSTTTTSPVIDSSITSSLNNFVPSISDIANFYGDIQVVPDVMSKVDSSYSSVFGATGTSGNEAAIRLPVIPINLTMEFP